MSSFNRLAVRKEIGAIRYRLADQDLSATLRHQIIARHLDNLSDTLPVKFHEILNRCRVANYNSSDELVAGLDLIDALVPATYGSIPAGIVFLCRGSQYTKRKEGTEKDGVLWPHLVADTVVSIVNH